MDGKERNKIEENKNLLIKNICYEIDTNKLMINDNQNNHYLCDIFGRKKIKFLPNITGSLNRYKRQYLQNDKNLSYLQSTYFSPDNSNLSLISKKINKNQINYHPAVRRFEGYSKFPRPIGPPLINIPNYTIKEKEKRKIIEKLNTYFDDYSVKEDIKRENENKGMSYITANINEYDLIKHDAEQSLKLINNNLDNYREEYKLKLNIMHKDPNVKALNEFKKKLLLNKNSKTINGRILEEPPEKITKNYKIIHSTIHKSGWSNYKKNEKNNLINIFNRFKYSKKSRTIPKFDNKYNLSKATGRDRLNELYKTKDFTIGRLITTDFGLLPDKKSNNISIIENNEANTLRDISKIDNAMSRNVEDNKNAGNEDTYKETEETMNNNISNYLTTDINIGKEKTLEEKINDNELSFISYMSENEKKYQKENVKNIKFIKNINENGEHDNTLLKGYQEKERMPPIIFPKPRILKLKSNGDLYKENLNLLKLTNIKAFKIQEQKDLYDLKMLEKKIKISTINANNIMKGKTLKVEK